jgi:hypothetical protein
MHFVITTAIQTYRNTSQKMNTLYTYTIDSTMEITVNHRKRFTSQQNKIILHLTVELRLSGRWLTGSPNIRIGLALREFYKTNLS